MACGFEVLNVLFVEILLWGLQIDLQKRYIKFWYCFYINKFKKAVGFTDIVVPKFILG